MLGFEKRITIKENMGIINYVFELFSNIRNIKEFNTVNLIIDPDKENYLLEGDIKDFQVDLSIYDCINGELMLNVDIRLKDEYKGLDKEFDKTVELMKFIVSKALE